LPGGGLIVDVVDYLKRTPPRCLAVLYPLHLSATEDTAVWRLRCTCGGEGGEVLGHPLGDFNPEYEEAGFIVSPLSFRCGRCGKQEIFLDTAEDGEGAEFVKHEGHEIGCAAYRGEGEPVPAVCPRCGCTRVAAIVTLCYNDERIWVWEDDPRFPLADCFNVFRLDCSCMACEHIWEVSTIDTKA
jgi:hypothetical protein